MNDEAPEWKVGSYADWKLGRRRPRKMYLRQDWDPNHCRRQGAEWIDVAGIYVAKVFALVAIDDDGPPRRATGTMRSSIE